MDSRLSDEQSFLLYLAKYDRPRHLDDGQFIECFWLTTATTLALLTTTPTEQRMRRRSKTQIN